eukprot:m.151414 g.151414  ORF g.151414 m.151414 type:complete len:95 (-) comp17859_c1_seq4:204-488(-)
MCASSSPIPATLELHMFCVCCEQRLALSSKCVTEPIPTVVPLSHGFISDRVSLHHVLTATKQPELFFVASGGSRQPSHPGDPKSFLAVQRINTH